ncbi:MAG: aminotransferase class I/II-fold pyridoxal phosphate-dependent enzyme [Proteobacteria bacterium]|jgi:threonine aldolase|nr:aminotransferase class I/II-fold pyridoxal phosphate-dependent enzyme [Pseudomonadota bacterium]
MNRGFGSDNHSPVHPWLFESLNQVNHHHAPSYGTDEFTLKAILKIRSVFDWKDLQVLFVFNGTAANVLALKTLCQSYQSVLVSDVSHLNVDECAAPEMVGRVKLIPLPSKQGKLQLKDLKQALIRRGDQHFSQVAGISITQPTELGTVYSPEELQEICRWAQAQGLFVHVDGARLHNALSFLKLSPADLFNKYQVDALSLGGTKNGFLFGEAVLFKKEHPEALYYRKQITQLPSKTRYIAAQFLAYYERQLFHEIAEHQHQLAQLLEKGLIERGICPEYPVQSNAVFVKLEPQWIKEIRKSHFFYVWDEHTKVCRLMMSWDSKVEDISSFLSQIDSLQGGLR